jgi:hypothetical protein
MSEMDRSDEDRNEGGEVSAQMLARLLFATARALYRASLMGVPCKAFEDLKLQVNLPRPGDWALEVSRFATRDVSPGEDVDLSQLGRLIRVSDEDGGRVFHTESIDGRLRRWVNVDLIRVFEHPYLDTSDEERLAWVAEAEERHGLPRRSIIPPPSKAPFGITDADV